MRPSGRAPDQMRELRFEPGFTRHAEGSVLVEFGGERLGLAQRGVDRGHDVIERSEAAAHKIEQRRQESKLCIRRRRGKKHHHKQ